MSGDDFPIKIIVDYTAFRRVELWTSAKSNMITIHTFERIPQVENSLAPTECLRMSKEGWINIVKAYDKYMEVMLMLEKGQKFEEKTNGN